MKRFLLYPFVSVLMLAGEPAVGGTLDLPRPPRTLGQGLLSAPVRWILSTIGVPFDVPAPSSEGASFLKREGWDEPVFELRDHGYAVLLEIQGGVEFDRATILLGDGSRLDLDLGGTRRGDGLFALANFAADREVVAVGLRARARSERAMVGVRLLRPAEVEPGVPDGTSS